MKLININILDAKFAIVANNRAVTNNKELKNAIKEQGVITPLTTINCSEVENEVIMFDAVTKDVIKKEQLKNYYLILDGQHRRFFAYNIAQEELEKTNDSKSKINRWEKIKKEGREKPVEYISEFNAKIPVVVYSRNELKKGINTTIIGLNSSTKNWKNKDYIDNAKKMKGEDNLIKTISHFSNLKFSISSISRWICFNKEHLNTNSLVNYTEYNTPIRYAEYERAIRLYLFLIGKGFSNDFLKKRYLIDLIIDEKQQNNNIEVILNKINYFKRAGLVDGLKDCDITNEVMIMINEDYQDAIDNANNEERNEIKELRDYLSLVDKEDVELFLSEPIAEKKETKKVEKETIKVEKVKKETKSNMPVVTPAENKAAIVSVDDVMDAVEDVIEDVDDVMDAVEEAIDAVEEAIEDAVEDTVEDAVGEAIEDAVEDSINKDIVDEVNDAIANDNFIDAEYSVVAVSA